MKQTTAILCLIACLLCLAGCGRTDAIRDDPMESPAAQTDGEPTAESPAAQTDGESLAETPAVPSEPDATPTEPEPIFESEPEPEMGFPTASKDPVAPHYPESFAAADLDFSGVDSILIGSGVTGKRIVLTQQEDLDAILASLQPLTGETPISSKGYYGANYRITCYASEPSGRKNTVLDVTVTVTKYSSDVILNSTVYEFDKFSYSAMYTMDPEVGRALIAACRDYIE